MNKQQATDRRRPAVEANPRQPNLIILTVSAAALLCWVVFLLLVALRVF